jgi:hypothetical protein
VARTTGVLTAAIALLLVGVQAWSVAGRERAVRATAENGAVVVLSARAASPRALLDGVRAADPDKHAMAVVRLPGGDTNPTVLAVDASRADEVLSFGHQRPSDPASALRPVLPASLELKPGVVQVGLDVGSLASPSPLVASVTVERPATTTPAAGDPDATSWTELALGDLRLGSHTYAADVPSWCAAGCRLVGLALTHPGRDIAAATADLSVTSIAAGSRGALTPLATAFDQPHAWRPGVPDIGAAFVQLTPGRDLAVSLSAPGGVPARIMHGDGPDPLPALIGPSTVRRGGAVQAIGLDGGLLRTAATDEAAFVPGLGRSGALVAALAEHGVTITGRAPAARAAGTLAKDGAVLSLMLFLICGGVALVVSAGAMLVAAFVGGRQRATEAASLRAVGVPRRVVRGGLLIENLAGAGVALIGGALAAAVAARVVLPVLPLFDAPSEYVGVSAAPDLAVGGWTMLAVALVLCGLATAVAAGQLRGGTVDRIREGTR